MYWLATRKVIQITAKNVAFWTSLCMTNKTEMEDKTGHMSFKQFEIRLHGMFCLTSQTV